MTNGISTNYVAGLSIAMQEYEPGVNNYVVFMSDGVPTNTQGPERNWSKNFVEKIGEMLFDGAESALAAIIGGWIGMVWEGNDQYGIRLLVLDIIEEVGEWTWKILKTLLGLGGYSDEQLINLTIDDSLNIAKNGWEYIMGYVKSLKSNVKKFYTIYYDTGAGNVPWYGIQQMATSVDDAYTSNNATGISEIFKEITDEIQAYEIDTQEQTENGEIRLKLYEDISAIQVGSRMLTYSELWTVKNKLKESGGVLDLKDPEISGMFKTEYEIIIKY